MNTTRRDVLKAVGLAGAAGAALAATSGAASAAAAPDGEAVGDTPLTGNVNHSVARWTYGDLDIEELCLLVRRIGFRAIDLCGPADWPVLRRHGVHSSMCNGAEPNLEDGWCDSRFHDDLVRRYLRHIDLVADAGYTNLVCFSGNKRGLTPSQGLANAAAGLARVLPRARERGVTLFMELFNSKVDHPDYMADNSAWGVALCQQLGADNFSLLYDIYHMQIMEGDVIRTIRDHHRYFGHYHTAGVPGRHEIDDSQELNYPAIARAVVDTGFTGYFAQEFIPTPTTREGRERSLADAIRRCDV